MTKKETTDSQQLTADSSQQTEVYDADNSKLVTRTPEQKRRSMHLFKLAEQAELIKWVALKHFFDGKGHLDFGYSTKEAFISNVLHEAKSTVFQKLQAATPFAELMPIDTEDGASVPLVPGELSGNLSEEQKENLSKVNAIGMSKLYLFARMDDADFSEALTGGVVKFGKDRPDVPLEEIMQRSFRQWSEDLKAEKEALTNKMNKYRREKDEAEADVEKLKAEAQENAEKVKRAEQIEIIHQKESLTLDQHYNAAYLAMNRLSEAGKILTKIKLPEDETKVPEDLRSLVASIYTHISNLRNRLYEHNRLYITTTLEASGPDVKRAGFDQLKRNPDPNGPDFILDDTPSPGGEGRGEGETKSKFQFDEETGEVLEEDEQEGPPSNGAVGDEDATLIYRQLDKIAEENGISGTNHFDQQRAVTKFFFHEEMHWHELTVDQASTLRKHLVDHGYEEIQRWMELGFIDDKQEA